MSTSLKLDRDLQDRVERLADARHQSPESIVNEAVQQYLQNQTEDANRHPSGKPWPRRNPVGGIITPV